MITRKGKLTCFKELVLILQDFQQACVSRFRELLLVCFHLVHHISILRTQLMQLALRLRCLLMITVLSLLRRGALPPRRARSRGLL